MQRPLSYLIPAVLFGLQPGAASALGFGRTADAATLGQPLNFSVALSTNAGENPLDASCVKAEVQVGDRMLPADEVHTSIERLPANGERHVRVTTKQVVDEPVVSITIKVGCPLALTRNFMVFADPPHPERSASIPPGLPVTSVWDSSVPSRRTLPAQTSAPKSDRSRKPAAASAKKAASASDSTSAARTRATSAKAAPAADAAAPPPRKQPKASKPPKAAASTPKGPVLQLDPVSNEAHASPLLRFSTRLSQIDDARAAVAAQQQAAAASQAVETDASQRAKDDAQLTALETAVKQLQQDYKAKQKTVDELLIRNAELADNSSSNRWLLYGLAGLSVVLSAALGAVLWLRRRERLRTGWWAQSSNMFPPEAGGAVPTEIPSPSVLAAEPDLHVTPLPGGLSDLPPESEPPPLDDVGEARPQQHARRPMTTEALIDLEQQVDFFVALGQDEAAIDLMMSHVRNTGGSTPLPYLKLLEIYHRRNEKARYQRIRERFNRRFNAVAPEWGKEFDSGLTLEAYPEVLSRIQGAWTSPSAAVALLDVLLFRRDAGPTFDLPAYRSLVFLYSIARELSEASAAPNVDLLLPMDASAEKAKQASAAELPKAAPVLEAPQLPPIIEPAKPPVADERDVPLDFTALDLPPLSGPGRQPGSHG